MSHNLKVGTKTLSGIDKITAKNSSGSQVEFISPAGSKTITANGTHDVKNYASAVVNVPSSGNNADLSEYVKIADTWNYTLKTRFNYGTFTPTSDQAVSATSISVGFKPKAFALRSASGMTTTGTKVYVNSSWMIADNNYEMPVVTIQLANGDTDSARTAASTGYNYNSSKAQSQHSNGQANVFWPDTKGVKGNGGSGTFYFKSGVTYYWFAWG